MSPIIIILSTFKKNALQTEKQCRINFKKLMAKYDFSYVNKNLYWYQRCPFVLKFNRLLFFIENNNDFI